MLLLLLTLGLLGLDRHLHLVGLHFALLLRLQGCHLHLMSLLDQHGVVESFLGVQLLGLEGQLLLLDLQVALDFLSLDLCLLGFNLQLLLLHLDDRILHLLLSLLLSLLTLVHLRELRSGLSHQLGQLSLDLGRQFCVGSR